MGTNYSGDGTNGGIIPRVMEDIFKRVETTTKDSTELLIRVSFIEVILSMKLVCLRSDFFCFHSILMLYLQSADI